jgi:uncharacterized Zn finger protein
MVSGTELYEVTISISPVASSRWKAICRDCAGSIDSLVELLQGRLSKGVMDRVCRQDDGLFPAPREIKLSCSCPDGADMCKHVAAVLYGVGARLDASPQLLFLLRGVDEAELLARAGKDFTLSKPAPASDAVLAAADVAELFGLDMADGAAPNTPAPTTRGKVAKKSGAASGGAPPASADDRPRPKGVQVGSEPHAKSRARPKHERLRKTTSAGASR